MWNRIRVLCHDTIYMSPKDSLLKSWNKVNVFHEKLEQTVDVLNCGKLSSMFTVTTETELQK